MYVCMYNNVHRGTSNSIESSRFVSCRECQSGKNWSVSVGRESERRTKSGRIRKTVRAL